MADQLAYKVALDACQQWLHLADDKLALCDDTSGDWRQLETRIETIKVSNMLYPNQTMLYISLLKSYHLKHLHTTK